MFKQNATCVLIGLMMDGNNHNIHKTNRELNEVMMVRRGQVTGQF